MSSSPQTQLRTAKNKTHGCAAGVNRPFGNQKDAEAGKQLALYLKFHYEQFTLGN